MTPSMTNLDAVRPASLERPSSSRGPLITLLCAASIGVIALTAGAGSAGPRLDAWTAAALTSGLWLAAILVVAPDLKMEHGTALAATVLYAVAFTLPAMINPSGSSIAGYVAFFAGWIVVPIAWLANPLVVGALFCYRVERLEAAVTLAAIALIAALTTLGMQWNGSMPGAGFWFWALAPAIVAIAAIVRLIARGPEVAAPAPSFR